MMACILNLNGNMVDQKITIIFIGIDGTCVLSLFVFQ